MEAHDRTEHERIMDALKGTAIPGTKMEEAEFRASLALRRDPSFKVLRGWIGRMLHSATREAIYAVDSDRRAAACSMAKLLDGIVQRLDADSVEAATDAIGTAYRDSPQTDA
jgi:hypothetical protein